MVYTDLMAKAKPKSGPSLDLRAKIFRTGRSQAVRIPKEFHLEGEEVEIRRKGDSLILRPKKRSWAALIDSPTGELWELAGIP